MDLGKVTQGVGGEVRLELEAPEPSVGRLSKMYSLRLAQTSPQYADCRSPLTYWLKH